jgi:hypothetical protein
MNWSQLNDLFPSQSPTELILQVKTRVQAIHVKRVERIGSLITKCVSESGNEIRVLISTHIK